MAERRAEAERAAQRQETQTWGRELSLFNNWIDPLLDHVKIQEIAIIQCDFLVSAMVDGGLSPRSR